MGWEKSDHFDGRRFTNPDGIAGLPFAAVARMLRERRTAWPRHVDVPPMRPPARLDGTLSITFIGHSTFLIQTSYGNLLTDPVYSRRAGPFDLLGPRRVRPPAVRFHDLPPIATVLLSHNHYDHCDLRTLRRLADRFDPSVITPLGNGRLLRSAGLRRVEELDWWDHASSGVVPITLTPARHFSARTPFDRNRALWAGFVLHVGAARVYFAGDTAYGSFFDDVRRQLGPIDLALLPIGAYEPRWFMQFVHMNPAEAVQAHIDVGAATSVGMHFGTFQLTTEGIDDPVARLAEACSAKAVDASHFRVLDFGGSIQLHSEPNLPHIAVKNRET